MAMISSVHDIDQMLEMLLQKMLKHGAITKEQKNDIKMVLGPALKDAGGIDANDPKAVDRLKKGVLDAVVVGQVAGKRGLEDITNLRQAIAVVALNFKDPAKLTPADKRQYAMGMACVLALNQDPNLKINIKLMMQDPKTLTPAERKEVGDTIEKIMPALNAMQDPALMLSVAQLAGAIKLVKDELAKDPTAQRTPEEDKAFTDSLCNLYGLDPRVPGKISGPIVSMPGNALGIVASGPAMGNDPINDYSGTILNASMQSATGVYTLSEDRDAALGETFSDNAPKSEAAAAAPEAAEPAAAKESLLSAIASVVEDAVKETVAPEKKESAAHVKEVPTAEPEYKSPSPFNTGGPKPPGAH
ncbi:MAG: hypothetical protein V4501_03325 [Pseudomonadota bacterium]